MDLVFQLNEGHRTAFLQHIIQSFGCSYVCLWSHLAPPANCLCFLDGIYREISNLEPSSSYGSHAARLFSAYSESVNYVDHDNSRVPGFCSKNNLPYMEFKIDELQRMASSEVQLQFYQEARIETAVFMGCASGEIELGMPHQPKMDLEMEMKNLFSMEFSRETAALAQTAEPIRLSSSSSSLRSLSLDSSEYSTLFNIATTTVVRAEPTKETSIQETLVENLPRSVTYLAPNITYSPHQQASQALRQIRNENLPSLESEDDAIQKAILAVLSSPSSANSSSNSQLILLNLPSNTSPVRITAFQKYTTSLAPVATINRKHIFRRAIVFFRNLNTRRRQECQTQEYRPTSTTRLHHMRSERNRREKLNENFQVLRTLLPLGTKKDKASVLRSTSEYLGLLKSQVSELRERNQELEARLLKQGAEASEVIAGRSPSANNDQRLNVEIKQTSEARTLDLRVTVRGECSMLELVIRILEFMKQQRNIGLLSIESNTRSVESTSYLHDMAFRLKFEGDDFDESAFKEAVERILDDVAR